MKTVDIKRQSVQESEKIIESLSKETEQVFAKACETARHAAELELERALKEYEQKAKQIVIKIREEAKARTAEIASRLSEAILQGIEKTSAEVMACSVIEFNRRAENITQGLCPGGAKQSDKAPSAAGDRLEDLEDIDIGEDLAGVVEDEKRDGAEANDEFEQWLKQ